MKDLVTLTAEAFAKGGPLEQVLTEFNRPYTVNPQQIQYADLTAKAMIGWPDVRGLTTLLEGETGVGKTLGYLIPLGLHLGLTGRRGLVSTYTLHLQHQIVQREFDVVAEVVKRMTGATITVAPQKGRRNFVSPSRVRDLMIALKSEEQLDNATKETLESLAEFPSGDISEWLEINELPTNVKVGDICLLPGADILEAATYHAHREAASKADVLVVTHALLLRSCLRWNSLFGEGEDGEPPFDAAIIDEADRVPNAAESAFNVRISVPMVESIGQSLEEYGFTGVSEAVGEWRKWMDERFTEMSSKYSGAFKREGAGGFAVLGDSRTEGTRSDARSLALSLVSQLHKGAVSAKRQKMPTDDVEEIHGIASQLSEFVDSCDSPGSTYSAPVIRWSPVRTYGSFALVPLEPGKLISRLWSGTKTTAPYLRTLVMTSATLDAPGAVKSRFAEFREQVGLNLKFHNYNDAGSASLSPERFGQMDFVLADRRVPRPGDSDDEGEYSNPVWIQYAARGIRAAQKIGGRSLVLLPSYRDVASIAEAARELGVDLIEHRPGERVRDHLPAFTAKDNPNGVLITPAAWEGVDLPGMLRHVIIPRIPVAVRDNARNEALLDNYLSRGLEERKAKGLLHMRANSNTRKKFDQGIGRGIRSPHDKVTLWVLDPRFPLPNTLTSDRRLRQRNLPVPAYMQYAACIPERFRSGIDATYEDAEIFMADELVLTEA